MLLPANGEVRARAGLPAKRPAPKARPSTVVLLEGTDSRASHMKGFYSEHGLARRW